MAQSGMLAGESQQAFATDGYYLVSSFLDILVDCI